MRTQSLFILCLCAAAFALYGCAELKDAPPTAVATGVAVHPPGFEEPASPNFHGHAIRNSNWDMLQCRTCHGQSYAGGSSGVSCRTCHTQGAGPENCTTCHGGANAAPPEDLDGNTSSGTRTVGAHQVHLSGPREYSSTTVTCSDCHRVPATVYEPGHVDSPRPAEVGLTSPLARTPSGGITPVPAYDPTSGRCSNTFCHGSWQLPKQGADSRSEGMFVEPFMRGNAFAPVWNGGQSEGKCGTCHGHVVPETGDTTLVPQGHVVILGRTSCGGCHSPVVDASGNIADKAKHMNGMIDVFGDERPFR